MFDVHVYNSLTELAKSCPDAEVKCDSKDDCEDDGDEAPSQPLQDALFMVDAHMGVHAPLVSPWPAPPLCLMLAAHQAPATEVFAAHVNSAGVHAQVAALIMVAHATTTSQPTKRILSLWLRSDLVLVDLNEIGVRWNSLGHWHADCHVSLVFIFRHFCIGAICNYFLFILLLH